MLFVPVIVQHLLHVTLRSRIRLPVVSSSFVRNDACDYFVAAHFLISVRKKSSAAGVN
jgi:hypothetical protein